MKVFVTGGTGFVGQEVVRQLLAAGHTVRCLARSGSEKRLPLLAEVELHPGDVTQPESLAGALEGCDAVIHLVGIIREFSGRGITFERLHVEATRNVLKAASAQGVRRYLHMSANGARRDGPSPYQRSKWAAEEAVRGSGLDWTIFRPSLIFGAGGEFVEMVGGMVRRLPVVPVIGDGKYRMAPVAVEDVAAGFVRALELPGAVGKSYDCCGPGNYSYDELLDAVGRAMGRSRVCKLHSPLALVRPATHLLEGFSSFPLTSSQLAMLIEGNLCDTQRWAGELGLTLHDFEEGMRTILGAKT